MAGRSLIGAEDSRMHSAGLEPATCGSVNRCSIQLSYECGAGQNTVGHPPRQADARCHRGGITPYHEGAQRQPVRRGRCHHFPMTNSSPILAGNVSDARLDRLLSVVSAYGTVMTAFSGGVDSTLVAAAARRALGREAAPAALGDSASLPRRELASARELAVALDLELIEVEPDEQNDPGYIANAGDRCYHCKSHLYGVLHDAARERGIGTIANGTNVDDLGDHRPGLMAAGEARVVSPLLEAGLAKDDVRDLARLLGLPNADKPAAACLSSRLPFGTPVTRERLEQVEAAEEALQDLGLTGFRVRHHETVARLEVPSDQWAAVIDPERRARLVEAVKATGFAYVALDLEGFRSGSGNVLLTVNAQAPSVDSPRSGA